MMMVKRKDCVILYMLIFMFKDLPDRSCVFYVNHPESWSTGNIREFFSQWNLLSYDRFDIRTHIIGVSLKKDTIDTSKDFQKLNY